MGSTGGLRALFLGSAKIALALIMTVGVVVLGGWGIHEFNEYRVEQKNADIGITKHWPERSLESLQVSANLKTVWREGKMQYQLELLGLPRNFDAARQNRGSFSLLLADGDNFQLASEKIDLSDVFSRVDKDGKTIGLSAQGNNYITAETYRRMTRWTLAWHGFPD